MSSPVFGRVLTAMVTPMTPDGALDETSVVAVAEHLVAHGHDGIVVNGTTGESPTLSADESIRMVRLVVEAVGDRVTVVAGVGSNDTAHSIAMARRAADAGAAGLLVVTPYYNKPVSYTHLDVYKRQVQGRRQLEDLRFCGRQPAVLG